jgi:PKD repeat protein
MIALIDLFGQGSKRDTMKHLTQLLLLCAVLMIGLVPSGLCAETTDGAGGHGFITVTNPPVADFYTSNQYSSAPFTVSFSDSSRGAGPMTWLWEFGDGTTSNLQNPTHTFKNNGDYTVRLTVTNEYGSNTKTVPAYIGVGVPPEAEFSASPRDGNVPLVVKFSDASKNRPTSWKWNFGDGNTSTEQNPTHTYATEGIYFVTLRVSNHFGSDGLTKSGYIQAGNPAPATPPAPPAVAEKQKLDGIPGLIQQAKGTTDKNLPTAGLIPPQFMALAAVLTSLAIVGIQIILSNIGFIWQFLMKISKFFADLIFGHAVEKLSEKEIAARKLAVRKMEPHFFGLSSTEIIVIEAAVLIVALAFMLADRAELTLEMVLIYIIVGAISVVLHDFAHRYYATKHGQDADTQFWGLGTIIMFMTAWLFGNAFGSSYRNLVNRTDDDDPRKIGIEMVAGPVVSIILMLVFLWMVTLGGLWTVAGGIGFIINLITAVYSLMPIETMDGLAIWRWNKGLYLALLVPLFLFYCYTFIMV